MHKIVATAVALAALTGFGGLARAEDKPLFDASRLSASVGINYSWFHDGDTIDDQGPPVKEFEVGPYAAYNLLSKEYVNEDGLKVARPLLSLTGSTAYGLDSHLLRTQLGLRLVLYAGGK